MSAVDALPAGSCKHRPISNGWSAHLDLRTGASEASAWCGYCKAHIELDAEWIAKFVSSGRAIPSHVGALAP